MRILWKESVIVSRLQKFSPDAPVTRWDFRNHLVFQKRALAPAYYYIGFVLPVFTQEVSERYFRYLDFLMREAQRDGFLIIYPSDTTFSEDCRLEITDEGRKFITWGRFTDKLIEKKGQKIDILIRIFATIGGVSSLVLLFHVYNMFIAWLASLLSI